MPSPFRVDVFNAAGVLQGSGPITNVLELRDTRRLDGIGEASFVLPAADPRNALIGAGSSFDLYDEMDGYLGRYYFKNSSIRDNAGLAERTVNCYDALIEFSRTNVGFQRGYVFTTVEQVIEDLLILTPGWRHDIESGIGNTTVNYEGESVFAALDVLRDRWGRHFRLTTNTSVDKQLDFGVFGEDSTIVLANLEGQRQPDFNMARNIGIISSIQQSEDGDWVVNRVIPIGAGVGEASITIEGATLGSYTVQTGTNKNGTFYYYLEDAASVAIYGVRPRVVNFTGIRPLSNNATDIQRAREALKLAAEAYLARHLSSKISYDLGEVYGLQQFPKMGDLIRLVYKGATEEVGYIDVNDTFYVMEMSRVRDADGVRRTSFAVSSTSDLRTSDRDVMVDVVRDVRALKLDIQPYPFRYEVKDRDFTGGFPFPPPDSSDWKKATFRFTIDNTVTTLTKVLLYFRSDHLPRYQASFINFASSIFEVYYETGYNRWYPADLTLEINGVDVTSEFDGPYATGGEQAIIGPLDITEKILAAPGGIYQEHVIEISSSDRTVDNTIGGTQIHLGDAAGEIFFTLSVQGTSQAIIST